MKKIKASDFASNYLNINYKIPFKFKHREYWIPIYDSSSQRELFKTGRQSAKSTFLANRIISRASTMNGLQVLYEAPRKDQSDNFSYQKLMPIVNSSEKLRPFLKMTSTGIIDGVAVRKYTCFKTGAFVKLSTTYNGADRDRGLSINDLYIDEVQDQLDSDINILAEGLSASNIPYYLAYAGTPKSESNFIEKLWKKSKQNVWMIRCDACNTWQLPGREHLEKSFRPEGLLCAKCERQLNMLNGVWISENPTGEFNGWHITQLMRLVPDMPGGVKWKDPYGAMGIYDKYTDPDMTRAKFMNEVLGFSYDSAEKPLQMADIKAMANPDMVKQEEYDPIKNMYPVVMGIDWGNNNKSYTVISISVLYKDIPHLVHMKKLTGAEADPVITVKIIKELYKKFECATMFVDNGMVYHTIHELRRQFGEDWVNNNINFVQYLGPSRDDKIVKKKTRHKERKRLFLVHRNEIMQLFISNIKQRKIATYNFPEFQKDKFYEDYLAVSYETRERDGGESLFFMNSSNTESPTDCFQSHLYSWLGLLINTNKLKFYLTDEED